MKISKRFSILLIAIVLISSGASGFFYMTTPVKAEVFNVVIPNANMGILDIHIVGDYEIHLTDVNLSGFFDIGNDTVHYDVHLGSADVVYSATLSDDLNISISYTIKYTDLNFSVSADSFSIQADYHEFSSRGELEIWVIEGGAIKLTVYEMVPRFAKMTSEWTPLEIGIIREMEVSAS